MRILTPSGRTSLLISSSSALRRRIASARGRLTRNLSASERTVHSLGDSVCRRHMSSRTDWCTGGEGRNEGFNGNGVFATQCGPFWGVG